MFFVFRFSLSQDLCKDLTTFWTKQLNKNKDLEFSQSRNEKNAKYKRMLDPTEIVIRTSKAVEGLI